MPPTRARPPTRQKGTSAPRVAAAGRSVHPAHRVVPLLRPLVRALRKAFPHTRIIVRAAGRTDRPRIAARRARLGLLLATVVAAAVALVAVLDRLVRALIAVGVAFAALCIWPGPSGLYDLLAAPLRAMIKQSVDLGSSARWRAGPAWRGRRGTRRLWLAYTASGPSAVGLRTQDCTAWPAR